MRIETIRDVRALIMSERATYKGNELGRVFEILVELNQLEAEANAAARVRPLEPTKEDK